MELKSISDEIYYEQDQEEAKYARRKDELIEIEHIDQIVVPMIETIFIQEMEKEEMKRAAKYLLTKGNLTLIQKRRFYLHIYKVLSYREIAKLEGVHFKSVQESVESCIKKLKKIYHIRLNIRSNIIEVQQRKFYKKNFNLIPLYPLFFDII